MRRRLAITLACAGAATLAVLLGVSLAVALVWPARHRTPAPPRQETRARAPVTAAPGGPAALPASAEPSRAPAAALRVHSLIFRRHGCEAHRCLQLFVHFPGGRWLDVGRVVVDLTTERVQVLPW